MQAFPCFAIRCLLVSERHDETCGELDGDAEHFERRPLFLPMQNDEKSRRGVAIAQGAFPRGQLLRLGVLSFVE